MNNNYEDIPKHRKKKESSTSKSKTKSKHKHDYSKECLLVDTNSNRPYYATYCRVCGKIGEISYLETEPTSACSSRMLTPDEICEKYKHLEKIQISNIWQKYVPICKGGE